MKQRPLILGAVLTVVVFGSAQAEVLCKSKSNAVLAARTACTSKEVQVDPIALGLQGPQGPPGPAVVVVDSRGSLVGLLLGANGLVIRQVHNSLFVTSISAEGFMESGGVTVYFESTDCSGEPLIVTGLPESPSNLLPPSLLFRGRVYYAGDVPAIRTLNSQLTTPFTSEECGSRGGTMVLPDSCCFSPVWAVSPNTVWTSLVQTVSVDSFGLLPPFRIAIVGGSGL
jgi:hypothetical protein